MELMEVGAIKFTWKIKNFSKLDSKNLLSEVFSLGDYKWQIYVYPKGDNQDPDHLSIFLDVADSATLPSGWSRHAKYSLTLVSQIDNKLSITNDSGTVDKFNAEGKSWGFSFIRLERLHDLGKGYLVEDTCIIEADVTIFGDVTIKSNGSSKDTSNEIVEKNSTEKDIDAFFLNLESEISSSKNLSLKEETEEALTVIKNALNRDPAEPNDKGRISQITDAFDVLSLLGNCPVLIGTAEQKEELLTMKENFFDLHKRAAKAAKDKNLFMQKEVVKRMIDRKLGRCLIEFKKAKEGTEQQEQNIATLQEQVDLFLAQIDEAQKKKANFSSKQEEMFELSKDLKAELEVLQKQWPEYEAKMKAAEEEEKKVGVEWHKMKQFVSSLKGPYSSSLKEYFM